MKFIIALLVVLATVDAAKVYMEKVYYFLIIHYKYFSTQLPLQLTPLNFPINKADVIIRNVSFCSLVIRHG